jgi:hypothetical protein
MTTQNYIELKKNILSTIQNKGPSLPSSIAKEINSSILFTSAFLSELLSEKKLKISHLRIGTSPIYFIENQKYLLEKFSDHITGKEKEAFILLKNKKFLEDEKQDPAIRVALRKIRDFAIPFKKEDKIFWRFFTIFEQEFQKKETIKQAEEKEQQKIPEENKQINKTFKKEEQNEFKNPLILKNKEKPKSEFILQLTQYLTKNQFKVIQEKEYKPKEYNCLIEINSDLGPITFLTQAKDKKSITETDLKKLLSNAQSIPLPALMITTGEASKKAKEFINNYSSILKIKKINL